MKNNPTLSIGILSAPKIKVRFNALYHNQKGDEITGEHEFDLQSEFDTFTSEQPDATFTLYDVVIGINFHWEQKENQTFSGGLRIAANPNNKNEIYAINIVDTEEYLMSVISSEMCGSANMPLLKAHAVISRSWVLAQLNTYKMASGKPCSHNETMEGLKWYDKEDHTIFNVCADDHCQRYQGLTRNVSEDARQAVRETKGEVLTNNGGLVDARFHKCCGGVLEQFSTCWDNTDYDYLLPVRDDKDGAIVDLSSEEAAEEFIQGSPSSFCNTKNQRVLQQVLNSYDQTTHDFYRWEVKYTTEELSKLVAKKSGKDIGTITEIKSLNRGPSARIYRLLIKGTKGELIVGKELEIRRLLSESHLYSSAFVVKHEGNTFTLRGAGWGHGVGLCQIGAAIMGDQGYSYQEILHHYYPNTEITTIY